MHLGRGYCQPGTTDCGKDVMLMIPYHETYASPNRWSSRRGYKILAAGVHITGGEMPGLHSWIMNPNAQASYNCVVKRDGKRISYVPEEYPAFGHGKINRGTWPLLLQYSGVNPNWYTLSVSRVGVNQNLWTPEQMESTIEILRYWSKKYGFPLRRPYIFGHFEIDSVDRWYCPGAPFFNELIERLGNLEKGGNDEMDERAIVIGGYADFPAVEPLAQKLNAGIFLRTIAEKRQVAKQIFVAGGGTSNIKGGSIVDLSGKNRYETTVNIAKHLGMM